MNPFQLFDEYYKKELKQSTLKIPSACCFSTIGLDGYPNPRFVSLKEVKDENFIVTGPLSSRKGQEIRNNNKVSLTFWWTWTQVQVRVQGEAFEMTDKEAEAYFRERNRDSRIVSLVSRQGEYLEDSETLNQQYSEAEIRFENKQIPKPADWGGWLIKPIRIEFMQFKESRFHKRTLYMKENGNWIQTKLQP